MLELIIFGASSSIKSEYFFPRGSNTQLNVGKYIDVYSKNWTFTERRSWNIEHGIFLS